MALSDNRKAKFEYEILEKFDTGIELLGLEVKSLRQNFPKIENAYITIRGGEAFLINANIPPYQPLNTPQEYNPTRNRKLILTKKELSILADKENTKGLTIVPIKMYNKGRKIKLEIAIVRGKKKFDKRENIKKRDSDRDIERTLKGRQ